MTGDISLILMTPHAPQFEGIGIIALQDINHNKLMIRYDREMFAASTDLIVLDDEVMSDVWGDHLYRIKLSAITAIDHGESIILINKL